MTPPLPKTIADLAQWQVYADELNERGDPLGALLAYELSLGDSPGKAQLAEFHRQTNRTCRTASWLRPSWMLGHVRSLNVAGNPARRLRMSREPWMLAVDANEFHALAHFLSTPACSSLESLSVLINRESPSWNWSRLMARLPSSCATFCLSAYDNDAQHVRELLRGLPAQVNRLACGSLTRWVASFLISDRFEEVDLRDITLDSSLALELVRQLEEHPRVRLRVGSLFGINMSKFLGERVVLGGEGDAALLDERSGDVLLLRRRSPERLQRRSGVITARAQLNRSVPETFGFERNRHRPIAVTEGDHLVRHGDGTWTARVRPEEPLSMSIDGRPVGDELVPLHSEARVELGGQTYRFLANLSGT